MIREATIYDAPYFVKAGEAFCKRTKQSFDLDTFADSAFHILTDDQYKVFVNCGQVKSHCALIITPSMYDKSETVARVFSTWGDGGLKCFKHALKWAESEGIKLFMADSLLDRRIEKFYQSKGMVRADTLYSMRLNYGN